MQIKSLKKQQTKIIVFKHILDEFKFSESTITIVFKENNANF